MISLDVARRSIELLVDAAELERRRAALKPAAAPDEPKRGYAWLFDKTILQADEGCDFDFMTVRSGTCGIQTVLLERSPKPVE